jgi:hypothetical protein
VINLSPLLKYLENKEALDKGDEKESLLGKVPIIDSSGLEQSVKTYIELYENEKQFTASLLNLNEVRKAEEL